MRHMKRLPEAGKRAVVNWFRHKEPNVYKIAVKRHALRHGRPAIYGLSGVDEEEVECMGGIGDFFKTLADTVKNVAEPVIAYKSQKDILKAQLKRGEQNLPPLQVADYAPVIRIQPQIGEDSEAALTRIATKTTGNFMQRYGIWLAGGVVGLVVLMRRKR